MMDAVATGMKERTGHDLDEWVKLVAASGIDPLDQLAVRRWLKAEHGVPQNSQWSIADAAARAAGWERPSVAEYIDLQYQGPKARLRPIFDRLADEILAFGDDVVLEGRSTYTPFVRGRQFAAIAAATRTRVDLGLRFTDPPASERLRPATSPGQSSHKIELASVDEVDGAVIDLARIAYEQNA
jgi:predicted transport protein